jgi:hypothetical protein
MANLQQEGKNFEDNPRKFIGKIILWVFGLAILIGAAGYALGWFTEAAKVTKEEFGPKASLKKYEWFKEVSAKLEQKKADIQVYEQKISKFEKDYEGVPRKDWDRTDKETINQWESELVGLKLNYNNLAAEYNAQSSKFNWAPYGNEIPQTYSTYITE